MEEFPNLINIGPTNPIQILNQHGLFGRFCLCPSNDTLKKSMLVLGLQSKDRKYTRDKANISNCKVNRSLSPTHSQPHLSRLCANFTWTLNTIYSTEGLPYWGVQRYVCLGSFSQWCQIASCASRQIPRRWALQGNFVKHLSAICQAAFRG